MKIVYLEIPDELKSQFAAKVKSEGLSQSLVLRELIKMYLKKNGPVRVIS